MVKNPYQNTFDEFCSSLNRMFIDKPKVCIHAKIITENTQRIGLITRVIIKNIGLGLIRNVMNSKHLLQN